MIKRDDTVTLIIILNKIAILISLPIQILFIFKYIFYGFEHKDLTLLLYSLIELYFSLVNFTFIIAKSNLKHYILRQRVLALFIPLLISTS
mmetsp:Transcript_24909/g.24379  ORF Transcript_24909/g.24379 Transcript_24909/m.24379 type:complete len:91 (+) Transcript_24909:53-325(+)